MTNCRKWLHEKHDCLCHILLLEQLRFIACQLRQDIPRHNKVLRRSKWGWCMWNRRDSFSRETCLNILLVQHHPLTLHAVRPFIPRVNGPQGSGYAKILGKHLKVSPPCFFPRTEWMHPLSFLRLANYIQEQKQRLHCKVHPAEYKPVESHLISIFFQGRHVTGRFIMPPLQLETARLAHVIPILIRKVGMSCFCFWKQLIRWNCFLSAHYLPLPVSLVIP